MPVCVVCVLCVPVCVLCVPVCVLCVPVCVVCACVCACSLTTTSDKLRDGLGDVRSVVK